MQAKTSGLLFWLAGKPTGARSTAEVPGHACRSNADLTKSAPCVLFRLVRGMTDILRRVASLLVAVWMFGWLAPIVHQTQCTGHHHGTATCPICQLAAASSIQAAPPTAPAPLGAVTERLPTVEYPSPSLLFRVEHPARGPPPARTCV